MSGRDRSPLFSRDRYETPVVKLRGLPYETTALDICKFFTECKIRGGPRGIFFTLNERKQPTGEAFIEMESFRDVDLALRRHKERIGARYVEIFESRKSVLDREIRSGATNEFGFNENRRDRGGGGVFAMDRGRTTFGRGGSLGGNGGAFSGGGGGFRDRSPIRPFGRDRSSFGRDREVVFVPRERSRERGPARSVASDFCVKLRGLPWSATKREVTEFLVDCNVLGGTDGVVFIMDEKRQKPSGDAYVEMESDQDISRALRQHKKNMGSRYVEVFEANSKDVARAKDKEDAGKVRRNSFMVNLRGLPYSATERDIVDWLLEAAEPTEVILTEDRRGRPSGQANAYFKTEKEAKTVVAEMHKRDLGTRYIECFYEEMETD